MPKMEHMKPCLDRLARPVAVVALIIASATVSPSPAAQGTVVVATPNAKDVGYVTRVMVLPSGSTLSFLVPIPGIGAQAVSSATGSTTCLLGGQAGTASVLRLILPRGDTTIALRVTSPTSLGARPSDTFGGRSSWHLATGLAIVRAST